jgi:hypothetical protein
MPLVLQKETRLHPGAAPIPDPASLSRPHSARLRARQGRLRSIDIGTQVEVNTFTAPDVVRSAWPTFAFPAGPLHLLLPQADEDDDGRRE